MTSRGTRSARRWYWLSTCDQDALTCSSAAWMALYPQPDSNVVSSASRPAPSQRVIVMACLPVTMDRRHYNRSEPACL
ncbi:Uncharacterised protein [Bordetella pertussis]|nr:Uncharacterised protein [Bordetella pertussis]